MPRPDPAEQLDMEEATKEAKLLNKLRVKSFTASPKAIPPFAQSTLTWDVFVPADVAAQLGGLRFKVAGAEVDRAGSKLVSPLTTSAFLLEAQGALARKQLGSVVVTVNTGGCQQLELRTLQLKPHAEKLRQRFIGGVIKERGEISVKTGVVGVAVTVPLKIAIENFFDADAEVELTLALSVNAGRIVVTLVDVDVNIIFHVLEHILSLGAATAAQSLIQPIAADLIRTFLGAQLTGDLSQEINTFVEPLLKIWQNADDPQKRRFRLYSITTTSVGVTITGCPLRG